MKYSFSQLGYFLKNPLHIIQETERAIAANRMIGNGVIRSRALAMTGANESILEYVKTLGIASAAELTFSQKIKVVTAGLFSHAKAWMLSPLGKATAIVAGIYLLAKGVDYLSKSLDRSREKLSELKEEFETNKSELISLENEFKTTADRIKELDELKVSGTITFSDQEELTSLQAQNAERQRTIDLLKLEQRIREKASGEQFVNTIDDFKRKYDVRTEINDYARYKKELAELESQYNKDLAAALASGDTVQENKIEEDFRQRRAVYDREISDLSRFIVDRLGELRTDSANFNYTPGAKSGTLEADINAALDYIRDLEDYFAIMSGEENAVLNSLNRLVNETFSETTAGLKKLAKEGQVTTEILSGMMGESDFEDFVNTCSYLGILTGDLGSNLEYLASYFNSLSFEAATSAEGLAGTTITLEQINEHIDNFQTRISSLSDALTKLNDGSISLGEVVDLIQEFPELASYVDLTSESFGNLDTGLKALLRSTPEKLIDDLMRMAESSELSEDLREDILDLCEALESMPTDAIEDVSAEFGILEDRINASTAAKARLDRVLSSDDHDAGHKKNIEYFNDFTELYKNGDYGSSKFEALSKYWGVQGESLEYIGKWIKEVSPYFKEGGEGVNYFLDAVARLSAEGGPLEGIASYDPKTGEFWYDFMAVGELAQVLRFEEEIVQDFFGAVRMKARDWQDRSAEDTRNELASEGLIFNLDDETTIASLDGIAKHLGFIDGNATGAREAVRALLNEISLAEDPQISSEGNSNIDKLLKDFSEGGSVDLTIRPKVSGKTLSENGWDVAADEIATVFTETFKNEDGTVAMNFTPIMVDENGNFTGVMGPKEFAAYCEAVVDGAPDDLGLKIGATFEGDNAIKKAEITADQIHRLHEKLLNEDGTQGIKLFGEDQITITQDLIDGLEDSGASVEDIEKALGDLNKVMDLEYDPDVMIGDKSIQDVLAEQAGIGEEEKFTIKITAEGSDEVLAEVTTTKDAINEQVRSIDSFEVSANCEDEASVSIKDIDELIKGLDGASATVNAIKGPDIDATLSTALSLAEALERIAANANLVVNVGGNFPGGNAAGTKHAKRGPSLLGEEYSPTGSPKPELVVSKDGAYIAGLNGPEMGYLNEGDIVYNADDTKEILRGDKNPHMIQAFGGGTVPPPKKPSGGFSGDSKSTGKNVDPSSEFEELYDYHQHLIAMDQESMEDYLEWLDKAYQEAFDNDEIDKKDYWKYQEEVYEELKELFNDYVDDVEHQINLVINNGGDNRQVVNMYQQLMKEIEAEIAKAKEKGLDENNEYVQELQEKLWDFQEEIDDIQEEIEEDAKDAIDDLIDYRIDMLKQELTDEKELLNDKLSNLKDFYSEQKELLKDAADEEEYIKNQTEKRKAVSDIQEEMARLRFDDSAFAKKRMLELQEELKEAEEELSEFEKDRALDDATELLDNLYEKQEEQIKSQIEDLDDRLNDPEALYNQALKDIQNNTLALYEEMVEYNNRHGSGNPEEINTMWKEADDALDKFLNLMGRAYKGIILQDAPELEGYARGTANATPGVHEVDEKGSEYVFTSSDGRRYRVFSGGEKILNANATNFLYKFATYGNDFFSGLFGSISKQLSGIQMNSKQVAPSITLGDIIVQGNADRATVSEIRREKRDEMRWILQEFNKMNKRI